MRLHEILKAEFVPAYPAPVPDPADTLGNYNLVLEVYRQYDLYIMRDTPQERITITI